MANNEDNLDQSENLTMVHLWEYLETACDGRWEELAKRLGLPEAGLEGVFDQWFLPSLISSRLQRLLDRRYSLTVTVCALTLRIAYPPGHQLTGGDLRDYRACRRPPVSQEWLASEWGVTQQEISAAERRPYSPLNAELAGHLWRSLNRL